jgi:hypothetical protein
VNLGSQVWESRAKMMLGKLAIQDRAHRRALTDILCTFMLCAASSHSILVRLAKNWKRRCRAMSLKKRN